MKKYILSVGMAGVILVQSGVAAFAQTVTNTPNTTVTRGAASAETLSAIISKGDSLISMRLTTLNNLLSQINAAKRLKTADKAQFTTSINNDISGLNTLKTKLDADTDITTARADVKSIFTNFRVYAVFTPQTHALAASDAMTTTADLLTTLATKLQSRIAAAGAAGNNVTSLNTLLSDMKARIADATTQYANAENLVAGLTPSSYPGSTTTLQTARADIKTGRSDLQTALNDAKQIIAALKGFKTASTTPTATVTH